MTEPERIQSSDDRRLFLSETERLLRTHDWAKTPLGPRDAWPASVVTAVNLVMRCNVPMVTLWGPEGVMIYNDAYSKFAGARHPALFGSNVREGWPEVAEFNDNVMRVGLAGGTLAYRNEALTLFRYDYPEHVWMDLDYSPIESETGNVAGVLAVVVETTDRVRANHRVATEYDRLQRLFDQAPSFMAMTSGPRHVFEMMNPGYRQLVGSRDILGKPVSEALPEVAEQGFVEMLNRAFATGEAVVGTGVLVLLQRHEGELEEERYVDFVFQPIRTDEGEVDRIFIQGSDVTERVLAERHQRLLMYELNHRLKNNMTIVHAIASRTLREAASTAEAGEKLSKRIQALARAQDGFTSPSGKQGNLRSIVTLALQPHIDEWDEAFEISGPSLRLSPGAASSMALALHELATNAAKYGALSQQGGRVAIRWHVDVRNNVRHLVFQWRETGGPLVKQPTRRGFGSRLIERGLVLEFGGIADLDYRREGLVLTLEIELDRLR